MGVHGSLLSSAVHERAKEDKKKQGLANAKRNQIDVLTNDDKHVFAHFCLKRCCRLLQFFFCLGPQNCFGSTCGHVNRVGPRPDVFQLHVCNT